MNLLNCVDSLHPGLTPCVAGNFVPAGERLGLPGPLRRNHRAQICGPLPDSTAHGANTRPDRKSAGADWHSQHLCEVLGERRLMKKSNAQDWRSNHYPKGRDPHRRAKRAAAASGPASRASARGGIFRLSVAGAPIPAFGRAKRPSGAATRAILRWTPSTGEGSLSVYRSRLIACNRSRQISIPLATVWFVGS